MKIITVLALILALGVTTAIAAQSSTDSTKTVDWYMAPENEAALEATLKKCRNNPGELRNDPNCLNAAQAQHRLFVSKPSKPVEFSFK